MTEHDVAIVGGGHNGLVCAAYLAQAGLDVVVLERRDAVAGAGVVDEPWPGYRVSSAAYVTSLFPPKIVEELELTRFGYDVSILTPDYFVPFPDGTSLTLWGDPTRDCENISRLSAHDADAYPGFGAYFKRVSALLRELLFVVPPNMRLRELPHLAATAGRFRRWNGRDLHEIVRLFTMSAADFLDEWFEDDRVKGALAPQAIMGAWCGPMSPGSAYVLMHHWVGDVDGHFRAWGWARGGMGGMSASVARAAEASGATVRTNACVARVATTSEGRAIGVELDDGSLVRAKRVISSAHPKTTYLDLVGRERLPAEVVRHVERYRTRSGSVKLNVALSALPTFPGWDQDGDVHRGLVAVSPSIEYLERAWDDAKYGRASRRPYAEIMFPTAHEDGLAPPGKHLMSAFTQYGPYDLRGGSWETERDEYARRVIDELAAFSPDLPGAIESIEVLTPRDLEERYGLVGGNVMHGELTPDQMFSFRPIPFYGDYRTPVDCLYLCGGGTHPGGGAMGVPGRNAATVVLKDHKRDAVVERVKSLSVGWSGRRG